MENRRGLTVETEVAQADGRGERRTAPAMIHRQSPGSTRRLTIGADKGDGCADFIRDLRQARVAPHMAQKIRRSAVDGRTTRHPCCAVSQKCREKIKERFGRTKTT